MAGLIQKLLKKSSSLRTITTFSNPQSVKLPVTLLFQQPNPIDFKSNEPSIVNPIMGSLIRDETSLSPLLQIYPSFPFGYYINPISQSGEINQLEQDEAIVIESGEDTKKVWADSVKKKRKKKMNKHKYKKLRKRLRRQT